MNNKSNLRSVGVSRPVDPATLRVLRAVEVSTSAIGCDFFVAGATARDLMLVHVYGVPAGRATRDIDFGIAVESWEQFRRLKEGMIGTGQFAAVPKVEQRLVYSDRALGFSVPIDLVPFGGVAAADQTIAWPPERDVVLNVAGFEEALTSSAVVAVEDGFTVRVASVPGLTLLKLFPWADRHTYNDKDAADLYRLLQTYPDAGNLDRLYDQDLELLEAAGFDLEVAGAQLLGRDAARICPAATWEQVRSWLSTPELVDQLVGQMIRTWTRAEAEEAVIRMVNGFCRGFLG